MYYTAAIKMQKHNKPNQRVSQSHAETLLTTQPSNLCEMAKRSSSDWLSRNDKLAIEGM